MADEDLALNEDQLLENLDETNGDNEAELINENEVSKKQKYFSPQHYDFRLICSNSLLL